MDLLDAMRISMKTSVDNYVIAIVDSIESEHGRLSEAQYNEVHQRVTNFIADNAQLATTKTQ